MLPWAKGWIASQVLDAHLIGPSWGINKRKYYRNFQTSRTDVLLEEIFKRLPHYAFTERDYWESGEDDFGKAVEKWAKARGLDERRSFIVTVGGMYGGYLGIRNARQFLLSKLLNSRNALRNIYDIASKLDRSKLFVAVHMRFGADFTTLSDDENARGKWNLQIPGEWYLTVCETIQRELGDAVQFHFFTDRGGPAFDEAVRRFNPDQAGSGVLSECSDLLLMSQADLCICSISSYSLMAGFLSNGLYLWYEPQLTYESGLYTFWGVEETQKSERAPTKESVELMKAVMPGSPWETAFRGYAMTTGSALPQGLVDQLRHKLLANDRSASLLEYGCLPAWTLASTPKLSAR
jgi:hypothetical protein